MKKFSWTYVKAHPYMFGGIVVVFGLLLWLFLNRGSGGSSSGTTVVSSGQSEGAAVAMAQAQLGANTAIALKQIDANVSNATLDAQLAMVGIQGQLELAALDRQTDRDLSLANLQATLSAAEMAATERMTNFQTSAQLEAMKTQLGAQVAMQTENNNFQLEYATRAYNSATNQLLIGANLQRDLSAQQLEAYKLTSLLSVIPSLKKKDRDETAQIIASGVMGNPVSYYNGPGPATILPKYTTSGGLTV